MNRKKKIRILHIVGAMNMGGTETMLMNVYRNINKDQVQFDFISYSTEKAHYDEEIGTLGGKVIKLSHTQSVSALTKAIRENGPYDAVHCHTLFHCGIAVLAAKLAGVDIRISHAHTTADKSDSLVRKLYMSTMRTIIHMFSTHLLSCSHEAGQYLFGEQGVKKKQYSHFPNLIDYKEFFQNPEKAVSTFKRQKNLEEGLVLGHIGRFIEPKNHKFLLEIMKHILKSDQNAKLLLVGDGDTKQQMEQIAKKEGIYESIRFVGIREDVATMLHSMDVFVFPSIYEGLGLVLLEAQAAGLPCVVSEAIQPEADLGIDLVSRMMLADGAEAWANKILQVAGRKEEDTLRIEEGFEKSGYSLPAGISSLITLYTT